MLWMVTLLMSTALGLASGKLLNKKQDLCRKCLAWKDFGLKSDISLPHSVRDRVECGWEQGFNWVALEKPIYQISTSYQA